MANLINPRKPGVLFRDVLLQSFNSILDGWCYRKEGQDTQDEVQRRDLKEELEDRERRHFSSKDKGYGGKITRLYLWLHRCFVQVVDFFNICLWLQRTETVEREGIIYWKVKTHLITWYYLLFFPWQIFTVHSLKHWWGKYYWQGWVGTLKIVLFHAVLMLMMLMWILTVMKKGNCYCI